MIPAEAQDGLRKSYRPRSNKIRNANLKNDKLVSHTLKKLHVGDISSDEEEEDQESDDNEEIKEEGIEGMNAKNSANVANMLDMLSFREIKVKEEH